MREVIFLRSLSTRDVLNVLGQVLEKLPMIVKLIQIVSNSMK